MIMNGIMEVEHLARKTSATNPPAISWKVLVMTKSAEFIEIMSAVNWQEKWYFGSNSFHLASESSYLVFSRAWAIVPCRTDVQNMLISDSK